MAVRPLYRGGIFLSALAILLAAGPVRADGREDPPLCLHSGDVNSDGSITAGDAQQAFFIVLEMVAATPMERCVADCNGDGNVTAGDAQAIFFAVLNLGTCPSSVPDGQRCTLDAHCTSGHCQNGFCCADGNCCTAASDCPPIYHAPSTCNDPAHCQGYRIDATCTASMCGVSDPIGDDSACTDSVMAGDCGPYPAVYCNGAPQQDEPACPQTCTDDSQCDAAAHCDGTCVAGWADGAVCAEAGDCTSGHCQNGFCCADGNCCTAASDCPPIYHAPSTCNDPAHCQGYRIDATCTASMCGVSDPIGDDSACGSATVADECGAYPAAHCNGAAAQQTPGCSETCATAADCDAGLRCVAGACLFQPTCLAILQAGSAQGDGAYTIQPDGSEPLQVYCDMTADGGGWTRLAHVGDPNVNISAAFYNDGLGTIADANYAHACDLFAGLDLNHLVMRVNMGAVRDYFRPTDGVDLCQLISESPGLHYAWSATYGGEYIVPSYYAYSGNLGGSADGWAGGSDGRGYLSFWGSNLTQFVGGCCHAASANYDPPADAAAWGRSFDLYFRHNDCNCGDRVCGDDGCGGSCGTCASGTTCQNGQCMPEVAEVCPGFAGDDPYSCCMTDDPCGWSGDNYCDCDGTCGWDQSDCGVEFCPGYSGPYTCCQESDPCGWLELGFCLCDGTCGWEASCSTDWCPGAAGGHPCCQNSDVCGWAGDSSCDCAGSCAWDADDCGGCTPNCSYRECGDDGCGGSCGSCPSGQTCDDSFAFGMCFEPCPGYTGSIACCQHGDVCGWADDSACDCDATCAWDNSDCGVCVPDCYDKVCGDDGCGGSCGSCPSGQTCNGFYGMCFEPCPGYVGFSVCCQNSDVCDWAGDTYCDCDGTCAWDADDCASCTPDCTDRDCGNDGCGGSCGTCSSGLTCDTRFGWCFEPCPGYAGNHYECQHSNPFDFDADGECDCGGTCDWDYLDCGFSCIPDCPYQNCGDDGCGGSCGTCPSGTVCDPWDGLCFWPCAGYTGTWDCCHNYNPCGLDSNAVCDCDAACAWDNSDCGICTPNCSGKACGDDGCGGSCGSCPSGQTCDTGMGLCFEPCPGYAGVDPCCQNSNPCSADGNHVCQCDNRCNWDIIDCSYFGCPGYSGSEYCCQVTDPCGWGGNGQCQCSGTCPWDFGDCD